MEPDDAGKIGYDAYVKIVGWIAVGGDIYPLLMPSWNQLPDHVKDGWKAAADAIRAHDSAGSALIAEQAG